jgi:hypothetical protein
MLREHQERVMRKLVFAMAMLGAVASPSVAAEWRCSTSCSGNSCSSRCGWVYSQQELYEAGQNRGIRNLDYNTQGGTRRPSDAACTAAIESGADPDVIRSYKCQY